MFFFVPLCLGGQIEIYSCTFFRQIIFMSGITFKVDERGQKTAAVIDLRKHNQLWEDFYDTLLAKSRAREPRQSLESVKRRFKLV
jgi:hypothetical protein